MNHVIHLPEYGFLGISGKDAIKFFQGYSTCELNDLDQNHSGIGATCNLKGRMLASYRLIPGEDGLLIRMDRRLVEPMIEFLKKYIVFSKAKLENLSDRFTCYGYVFNTPDASPQITCPEGKDSWYTSELGPVICVEEDTPALNEDNPGNHLQRCELWLDTNLVQKSPVSNADADLWHQAEIRQGIAWVNFETREEYLPQMLNYDKINGISFEKGCYLGQEIVARMQYRGALKRKLFRGTVLAEANIGDTITNSQGRTVGAIVAASQQLILAVVQAKENASPESPATENDDIPTTPAMTNMTAQLANGASISLSEVD